MKGDSNEDQGHSVARCRNGLAASQALVAGSNLSVDRDRYTRLEAYWKKQLAFAEARDAS